MRSNLILGAGVTGLAAGFKTGFPIFEASDKPGGICRSYYKDGYRFENGGGHWIFGERCYREFVHKYSPVLDYNRNAGVYLNTILPYPIQTYPQDAVAAGSLKCWMAENFSPDLCRIFFFPFNKKYTANLDNEILQEYPNKTPKNGNGYNETFSYPIQGLDHFVDSLAEESTIHYNKQAVAIDLDKRIVVFQDASQEKYDRLISTIPLNQMMKMCNVRGCILPYTSVIVINIGARIGTNCPKEHWIYIPGKEPFFRIGFYSNVASHFAPKDRVSICVERALQPDWVYENSYKADTIRTLKNWGWIGDVDTCEIHAIECAYTWLSPDSEKGEYLQILKNYGVESIGRYGKWRFQGIAESIADGLGVLL